MTGCVFFFEHKTAYELRISDWSSDVCSSDLHDFNARVRVPGGFRLTNSAGERRWNTASGRAAFISHDVPTDLPVHRARASREQPVFTLTTVRSHDQYNTTIYGLDDRYRGVFGERRALFANAGDIAGIGLRARDQQPVKTPSGRAALIPHEVPTDLPVHGARASREQPGVQLTTVRSHDQYNTTIYGLDDRYRGVFGERRALFANAGDIAGLGLRAGDRVDLESLCDDGVRRRARRFLLVEYNIPRGCLARSEEHTSELQSLMRNSYAVFCLKKKHTKHK